MKDEYIKEYGEDVIKIAEYLCDYNGGHLNYGDKSMVDYWVVKDLY